MTQHSLTMEGRLLRTDRYSLCTYQSLRSSRHCKHAYLMLHFIIDDDRFVYMRMDNPGKGEYLLEAALQLNPDCEVALFHLSVIYQK